MTPAYIDASHKQRYFLSMSEKCYTFNPDTVNPVGGLKCLLVEPPASLVLHGTVPFVVVVVPVEGAELDALVAGPV